MVSRTTEIDKQKPKPLEPWAVRWCLDGAHSWLNRLQRAICRLDTETEQLEARIDALEREIAELKRR